MNDLSLSPTELETDHECRICELPCDCDMIDRDTCAGCDSCEEIVPDVWEWMMMSGQG